VNVDAGALEALTAQVADLTARVEQLADQAFVLKTLDEMVLEHAALKASRPRHLRAVQGGQR
jgi:hypothetical protein